MKRIHVFLLAIVAFAACGRPTGPGAAWPRPNPVNQIPPPPATNPAASFASLDSALIQRAALRYPAAAATEAAPLSLTTSDGTGLALRRLQARAYIDGPLAFTELHLTFQNPEPRRIEGRFRIALPEGAAISRLAMLLDSGWMEAEVVERQKARQVYEDFLHRSQDPALLEKAAGNEFRARIFPIEANAEKEIIISYSQELTAADQAYVLPLRGLPEIGVLDVIALVREPGEATPRRLGIERERFEPTDDFVVNDVGGGDALRHADVAVVRVRPQVPSEPDPIGSLDVLFDTSASRAPGFAGQVRRLGELLAALGAQHPELGVRLFAFDQSTHLVATGAAASFGSTQLDALLARRPLGASDLGQALVALGEPSERVLVVTDGVPTAGATDGGALRGAVGRLKSRTRRIDVIVTGGIRDTELMTRLVRGVLARDGLVIDGDRPIAEQARRLSARVRSGIRVGLAGAQWVWPEQLDNVQPGDERLVYASLTAELARPSAPLVVTLDDAGALQRTSFRPRIAERPLLRRAAGQAEIARLAWLRDEVPRGRASERRRLEDEIVAISTQLRVLSDFTALLVLETEQDYERYGIQRRSLADILTVDEQGLRLLRRTGALVVAESSPPRTAGEKQKKEMVGERIAVDADGPGTPLPTASAAPPTALRGGAAEPSPAPPAPREEEVAKSAAQAPEAPAAEPAARPRPAARRRGAHRSRQSEAEAPPPPADTASEGDGLVADSGGSADFDEMDEAETNDIGMNEEAAGEGGEPENEEVPQGPPPLIGRLAQIMGAIRANRSEQAVVDALAWRNEDFGDVLALIALGEALEARGQVELAARAYGSLIDLFPSRADLRRMAGNRLDRLGAPAAALAMDTYRKAVEQRPDHLTGHRMLAYALVRAGAYGPAIDALEAGLAREYPSGRFDGGRRILTEDLGLVAAAWVRADPRLRAELTRRLAAHGAKIPTDPSLRFVLSWETDANDVDFHIYDGRRNHAFYSAPALRTGGELYADITNGFGPECFTIEGQPQAYPYWVRLHYYSRGPMGYGMGKLEIVHHDGRGRLSFEQRPFVVMQDDAYVDLGLIEAR